MKKIGKNMLILLAAFAFALILFYAGQDLNLFSASILSLQEQEFIEQKNRHIAYKNQGNILDTFVSEKLQDINNITFSIIYDHQNTDLDLQDFDSQTEYKILSNMSGEILIQFTNFSGIDYDYQKSLFELPFQGNMPNILISEGIANLVNGENQNLSIGLLNENLDYHQDF
ncbi:MAG TPA: hypothetical protein P5060_02045 [Candidatus Absconditabacterales bacterium]|nr:hypothetical protein [Candidatus Absconditabacterales bacterium]